VNDRRAFLSAIKNYHKKDHNFHCKHALEAISDVYVERSCIINYLIIADFQCKRPLMEGFLYSWYTIEVYGDISG